MTETDHKSTIYGVKGIRILWTLFSLFVLYATLVPFSPAADFQEVKSNISEISWIPFFDPDGSRASIPDIVQNVFLFLPFGFLGVLAFHPRRNLLQVCVITVLGFLLSCTVEILQLFTANRTTSATDIVTNSAGTFLGAALTVSLLGSFVLLQHSQRFVKYRRDKYLALVFLATVVVAAGALQPFDFSLDVGGAWSKLKTIKAMGFSLNPVLRDEGVVFLRMFLFGFIWSIWLGKLKWRYAVSSAAIISVSIAVACEVAQLVVRARVPTFQDVFIVLIGCSLGAGFSVFRRSHLSQAVWSNAIIICTIVTVAMQVLSPFRVSDNYSGFNWFPFLAYYERTTFIALSNFIESMLMFFPLGFILQYFNPLTRQSMLLIALLTLMIVLPLEFLQGWITGRYADITDVLGGIAGALTAAGLCVLWYREFTTQSRAHAGTTKRWNVK